MKQSSKQSILACIGGAGRIGTAIIDGLLATKAYSPNSIYVTARHSESLEHVKARKLHTSTDNCAAIKKSDIVLICVHPDEVKELFEEIGAKFTADHLIISVVSGCSTSQIEEYCPDKVRVIRAMPNTPVKIRQAMTCLSAGKNVKSKDLKIAQDIFSTVGEVEILDERHMDAATGLGGCGPAFVFKIIEALSEGGVKMGLPRSTARKMAAQVLKGSAELVLQSGQHPAELKDSVTTPGGCTIDGLTKLEERGLSIALIEAVETATRKSRELLPKK